MDRQSFFNVGVRHILRAGPAFIVTEHKGQPCTVSQYLKEDGTACFVGANLLEILPAPKVRALADISPVTAGMPVFDYLAADSAEDKKFVMACMKAHDTVTFTNAHDGGTIWRATFIAKCKRIAKRWKLDTSALAG